MAEDTAAAAAAVQLVASHLLIAKYYMLASVIALWWDLALTFSTEVERIWSQPWTGAKVLWFIHRYYNPLLYIITVSLAIDPIWSVQTCERIVLYPVVSQLVSQFFISIILMLRTYALYGQSKAILGGLIITYICCLACQSYPLQFGVRIPLPSPLVGCILGGTPDSGLSLITYWIGNTTFDAVVFVLTTYKTLTLYRQGHRLPLIALLLRDGALYFGVIFCANTMTILTFALAPPTLKVVHATFAHVVTVILVSHLMLNLKQQGAKENKKIMVHSDGKIRFEDATSLSPNHEARSPAITSELESIGEFTGRGDTGVLARRLSTMMGPLAVNGRPKNGNEKAGDLEMGAVKQWARLGLPPSRPPTAMGSSTTLDNKGGVTMVQEVVVIGGHSDSSEDGSQSFAPRW